jgi:hypothetical protein
MLHYTKTVVDVDNPHLILNSKVLLQYSAGLRCSGSSQPPYGTLFTVQNTSTVNGQNYHTHIPASVALTSILMFTIQHMRCDHSELYVPKSPAQTACAQRRKLCMND